MTVWWESAAAYIPAHKLWIHPEHISLTLTPGGSLESQIGLNVHALGL